MNCPCKRGVRIKEVSASRGSTLELNFPFDIDEQKSHSNVKVLKMLKLQRIRFS